MLGNITTGQANTYSLVFPTEADSDEGKISILAPIGTAILGYRSGDTIEWSVPSGLRRIKVDEILYQPEASGDYDLSRRLRPRKHQENRREGSNNQQPQEEYLDS